MNEYLKIFQNIEQSVRQLLKNEYSSIESREIKESATELNTSIQPCIQELKLSTAKLKELIKPCFDNLIESEDIWNSKIRISETPKDGIWQQLGEISAHYFRIQQWASAQKVKLTKESRASWEEQIEELREKYFLDEKKQIRTGVSWPSKENFSRSAELKLNSHCQKLDNDIKKYLNLMFKEIYDKSLAQNRFYINLFDVKLKTNLAMQTEKKLQAIRAECHDLTFILSNNYLFDLKLIFAQTFSSWKSRWGNISWGEVDEFKNEVAEKSDRRIKLLIDDRVYLMKQALEQEIAFYNKFLEKQERYQQETLEQRLAEKAWIDHQRQELEKLQASFNTVLETPIN